MEVFNIKKISGSANEAVFKFNLLYGTMLIKDLRLYKHYRQYHIKTKTERDGKSFIAFEVELENRIIDRILFLIKKNGSVK